MKTTLFSFGAALAIALVSRPLQAQDQSGAAPAGTPAAPANPAQAPAATQAGGLLGRTYTSIGANMENFRDLPKSPDGYGSKLDLNVPVTDHLDYTFNDGFEYADSHNFHLTDNDFGNSLTTYYKLGSVSPYATAGFDYEWEHIRATQPPDNLPGRFDRLNYDLGAGLEFPLTQAASLRAGIGDDDASLRRPHERSWDYDFSANYWLGSVVGTFLGAQIKDDHGGALNATEYTAGLRFSFD